MSPMRRMTVRLTTMAYMALVLLAPLAAYAEAVPPVTLRKTMKPAWGIIIAIILALVTISISLIPSKRGHQD